MLSVLTHVIITRFSYRGARVLSHIGGESFHRDIDPLDRRTAVVRSSSALVESGA
jgi:hypothetical protein